MISEYQEGLEKKKQDVTFSFVAAVQLLNPVCLFATSWTVAHQAPLSMEFSRQEYWSGLPFPSPGDIPNPGIEPKSPAWQVVSLPPSHMGTPSIFFKE